MEKKPWKNDVAVLLIFFARDEQFKQVFEEVKKARPRVLLMYQDGAREGRADDVEGIRRCREIAEDIDWDCEVHTYYQDKNFGCDPSCFIAHKWAFGIVDKCIVLEDDVVPSQSFFPYCKELLDKYENDERINIICGMNHFGVTEDVDESYFFTKRESIWGWASWKRVIDSWDETYSFLDDEKSMERIRNCFVYKTQHKKFIRTCKRHKASGRTHHESVNAISQHTNNRVNIMPKYNMISNVGISKDATHAPDNIKKMPKRAQNWLYMKRYEIDLPLKHPKYVIINSDYDKKLAESVIKKACLKLEGIIRGIIYK